MRIYGIYNLNIHLDNFKCDGYEFKKVAEYDNAKEKSKAHQHTFDIVYPVDESKIRVLRPDYGNSNDKWIINAVDLLRFLTGQYVCLGQETDYPCPIEDREKVIFEWTGKDRIDLYLEKAMNKATSIGDTWRLWRVLGYYFEFMRTPYIEMKVGAISTCLEVLSKKITGEKEENKANKETEKLQRELCDKLKESIDSSEFDDNVKKDLDKKVSINKMFKTEKSMRDKYFDFMNSLSWSDKVSSDKLKDFCNNIWATRNLETHAGKVIDKKSMINGFSDFKGLKETNSEEVDDKMLTYIFYQTKTVRKIVKIFIAELIGCSDGHFIKEDIKSIVEFVENRTCSGMNPLK